MNENTERTQPVNMVIINCPTLCVSVSACFCLLHTTRIILRFSSACPSLSRVDRRATIHHPVQNRTKYRATGVNHACHHHHHHHLLLLLLSQPTAAAAAGDAGGGDGGGVVADPAPARSTFVRVNRCKCKLTVFLLLNYSRSLVRFLIARIYAKS